MTKKISKIVSLVLLSALLILSALPCVSAAELLDQSKRITLPVTCTKPGYTFEVFHVGNLVTSQSSPYETKYESLVPEINDAVLNGDTAQMIAALDQIETFPESAPSIGKFVTTEQTTTARYENLPQGIYYIRAINYPAGVKAVTNSVVALPYYNNGWIYETQEIDLAQKVLDDIPTTHKSITNSNNENYTDVSLGDTVNFQIKSTTAGSNQMKLQSYTVNDDMSAGLTLDKNSFTVSLLDEKGQKLDDLNADDYTVNITKEKSGENTEFSVSLSESFLSNPDFYSAAYTVVSYSAVLNKYAITGFDGNPNTETTLAYTNQKDISAEIEGNTVYVYTYSLYIDKVNHKNEKLKGAEFALYKTQSDAENNKNAIANGTSDSNGKVLFYSPDKEEVRLQSGTYYARELSAPKGYNLYGDVIEIEIKATYGDVFANGTYITGCPENGYAFVSVKNTPVVLPQTGGSGTWFLYIFGGICLISSLILFKVRKKAK